MNRKKGTEYQQLLNAGHRIDSQNRITGTHSPEGMQQADQRGIVFRYNIPNQTYKQIVPNPIAMCSRQ